MSEPILMPAREVMQAVRAPHCRVPQDLRTVMPQRDVPPSAPQFTVWFVVLGWILFVVSCVDFGRSVHSAHVANKRFVVAKAEAKQAQERSVAAEKNNRDARSAQDFVDNQEKLLGEVGDTPRLTALILSAKPAHDLDLVEMTLRRRGGGSELGMWDLSMKFMNANRAVSANQVRDRMMTALESAGLAPRPGVFQRNYDADSAFVEFAAILPPDAAQRFKEIAR